MRTINFRHWPACVVTVTIAELFYFMAVLLESNYYRSGGYLEWTTPISSDYLLSGIGNVRFSHILSHVRSQDGFHDLVFVLTSSILSLLIFWIAACISSKKAAVLSLLCAALALAAGGWVGILGFVYTPFRIYGCDGEWLGEGWPYFCARAVWAISFSCLSLWLMKYGQESACNKFRAPQAAD